jgi:hypothetical protein
VTEPAEKAEAVVAVARPVPPPALRAPARLAIITRRQSPSTEPRATRSHAGTGEMARDWAAEAASMAGRDLHARSGVARVDLGCGARSGEEELDPAAWSSGGGRQRGGEGGAEAEEVIWTA